VTAEFETGRGLYANANVAYRGTTIGPVTSVSHPRRMVGVQEKRPLASTSPVPDNVTATVKGVAAVGAVRRAALPS
jgi:phospholipid/cholesterol/gamma-HCH transport system substrate-binding protein